MPLYEYTCTECKTLSEILIRGTEEPVCPKCESTNLEKQVSAPAVNARPDGGDCQPGGG